MATDNHRSEILFFSGAFLIEFEEAAHGFTQIQNVTWSTIKEVLKNLFLCLRAIEKLIKKSYSSFYYPLNLFEYIFI